MVAHGTVNVLHRHRFGKGLLAMRIVRHRMRKRFRIKCRRLISARERIGAAPSGPVPGAAPLIQV